MDLLLLIGILNNFLKLIKCQTEEIIFGGTEAIAGDFPGQVSLQDVGHYCGGTLIRNDLVITAAHCLAGHGSALIQHIEVVACDIYNKHRSSSKTRQISKPDRMCIHEKYKKDSTMNDIAILRLQTSINFTEDCHAVELAKLSSEIDTECQIAGWGLTEKNNIPSVLQMGQVKIKVPFICRSNIFGYGKTFKKKMMICAGDKGIDSCMGDSGGPLICNEKLEGITSFGDKNCGKSYGVYTRVPYYYDWIKKYMETGECSKYF